MDLKLFSLNDLEHIFEWSNEYYQHLKYQEQKFNLWKPHTYDCRSFLFRALLKTIYGWISISAASNQIILAFFIDYSFTLTVFHNYCHFIDYVDILNQNFKFQ